MPFSTLYIYNLFFLGASWGFVEGVEKKAIKG